MALPVSQRRRWVAVGLVICSVLVLACLLVFLPNPAVMRSRMIHTVVQSSVSMLPTIGPGDWLVIVPGGPVRRGDVVVHAAPPGAPSPDPLLKRVVGLPGDTVEVRNGRLFLNGATVSGEPLPGTCTLAHVWKPGTSARKRLRTARNASRPSGR